MEGCGEETAALAFGLEGLGFEDCKKKLINHQLEFILAKSKLFIIQYPDLGYSVLEYNMSYSKGKYGK